MTSVLGSTHVVEQLSFSMFPSTLAFDFDLMFWSFLTFWALMGYFWGWSRVHKTVLWSTHVVVQLSFCMFPSILVLVST